MGRIKLAFAASTAFVLTLFVFSLFYTMPSNVLSQRDGAPARTFFTDLLPQNWAFFTKSPREDQFVPVRTKDSANLLATPQVKASNIFGLSRNQRAQGVEIGAILQQVHKWQECDGFPDCVRKGRSSSSTSLAAVSNDPTLCGDLLLLKRNVVPWSYRSFTDELYMFEGVIRVDVQCP